MFFNNDERVVITGLGTINPLGVNVKEFWDHLCEGKNGVRKIRNIEIPESFPVRIAAEVDYPDDIRDYFSAPRMIKRMDRNIVLSHIAGTQALRDSGIEVRKAPERYGVILGTGEGGLMAHEDNQKRRIEEGIQSMHPLYVINGTPNSAVAFFSQHHDFQGPSFSVNSACASSNHAIGTAYMLIKSGMADAVFSGGTEAAICGSGLGAFGNIMALSTMNDSPETASRPFDKERNGFVMGEGSGVICLESLSHARKRGARIYAELSGFSFRSDSHDMVAPDPEGKSSAGVIREALKNARVSPEDISFINAHGTSTPVGDKAESIAINRAMPQKGSEIPVQSTKSMTGHLLGGAAGVEAIAGIMAFARGVIHKTRNLVHPDSEIHLNVLTETLENKAMHFLSNSFGFGGHNAALVFSRFNG